MPNYVEDMCELVADGTITHDEALRRLGDEFKVVATGLVRIADVLCCLSEDAASTYLMAIDRLLQEAYSIDEDGVFTARV